MDSLGVAGLFLSLVGLLATFYSINIGDWYARVLSIYSRWRYVEPRLNEEQKKQFREIRYLLYEIDTPVPYLISSIIFFYVVLIYFVMGFIFGSDLVASKEGIAVASVSAIFILILLFLGACFLWLGRKKILEIKSSVEQ